MNDKDSSFSGRTNFQSIPVMYVKPPIRAIKEEHEQKINTNFDEIDVSDLIGIDNEKLNDIYTNLLHEYQTSLKEYQKLERKRLSMSKNLSNLQHKLEKLNQEQKEVEAEYIRLGLDKDQLYQN